MGVVGVVVVGAVIAGAVVAGAVVIVAVLSAAVVAVVVLRFRAKKNHKIAITMIRPMIHGQMLRPSLR